LGATELALILVIVLVLFGAGRLPQVFESLGKAVRSFRDAQREPVEAESQRRLSGEDVAETRDGVRAAQDRASR
jgi:sec-independent protein translocase protein TatA